MRRTLALLFATALAVLRCAATPAEPSRMALVSPRRPFRFVH